jgi:hypothetical protein
MTNEELLAATAVNLWKLSLSRIDKLFLNASPKELEQEIAPGKNRLIYLWGHLTAVNDAMLPLLSLGPRLHPELDAAFVTAPDKTAVDPPSHDDVRRAWNEVNAKLAEGFAKMSPADWLKRHNAVSDEDFAKEPLRNRLAILLSRASHLAYHYGQAALISK